MEATVVRRLDVDPRPEAGRPHRSIRPALRQAWYEAVRQKVRVNIREEAPGATTNVSIFLHPGRYEDDLVFPKASATVRQTMVRNNIIN
jgi:hypothetical protein